MERYVNHPYMERMLAGKITKNLAEVVKMIDAGEADKCEGVLQKNEGMKRQIKMAQLTGAPIPNEDEEHNLNESSKIPKKHKKDKKSKKIKKHKKKKKEKTHEERAKKRMREYKRLTKDAKKIDIAKTILQKR